MATTKIISETDGDIKVKLKAYSSFEPYELKEYLRHLSFHLPGVHIEIERMSTTDLTKRLTREKDNLEIDMILGWADTASKEINLEGQLFAPNADADGYLRLTGFSTAFVADASFLAANLITVGSWNDLTNPALVRRLAFPNPAISGAGFLALTTILQFFGEVKGWDIITSLMKNVKILPNSAWEPASLTGNGEITLGITVKIAALNRQKEASRLTLIEPQDVVGVESEVFTGFLNTKHPKTVNKVLEWFCSEEAKIVFMNYNKVVLNEENLHLFKIDAVNAVRNRTRWLTQFESILKGNNL